MIWTNIFIPLNKLCQHLKNAVKKFMDASFFNYYYNVENQYYEFVYINNLVLLMVHLQMYICALSKYN